MKKTRLGITLIGFTATIALTACSQQEEEVVVDQRPILAKDGTVIGFDPVVTPPSGGAINASGTLPNDSDVPDPTGAVDPDPASTGSADGIIGDGKT